MKRKKKASPQLSQMTPNPQSNPTPKPMPNSIQKIRVCPKTRKAQLPQYLTKRAPTRKELVKRSLNLKTNLLKEKKMSKLMKRTKNQSSNPTTIWKKLKWCHLMIHMASKLWFLIYSLPMTKFSRFYKTLL